MVVAITTTTISRISSTLVGTITTTRVEVDIEALKEEAIDQEAVSLKKKRYDGITCTRTMRI